MDKSTHNLLHYWRNTLADSARVEVDLDKATHLRDCKVDLAGGKIEISQAIKLIEEEEKVINKQKGVEDPNDSSWLKINEVKVLISLFCVYPRPEYAKLTGEEGPFYPFWINAVMNKEGKLKLPEDKFPYVPRVFLEPQVNEKVNFTFCGVDIVDEAFTVTFNDESWEKYWKYIQENFTQLTGQTISAYKVENYETDTEIVITINNQLSGAADGIIKLYDYLLHSKKTFPALIKKLCERNSSILKPLLSIEDYEDASLAHLGQMGHKHALSFSQRRSLYHFYSSKNNEILAVNGPPGTGKTTLLQSIVANEVVQSAIEGKQPRIIVACSTNNQAVTNIIDSFGNIKSKAGVLYERWIPDTSSFALYLPGKDRQIPNGIPFYKGSKEHSYVKIETWDFIKKAKNIFRDKAIGGFNYDATIEDTAQFIRQKLLSLNSALKDGIAQWKMYKSIASLLEKLDANGKLFTDFKLNDQELKNIEISISDLETKFSDYLDRESIWIKLFAWLPFIKQKRATRFKQLFRNCPVNYDIINFYSIKSVNSFFDTRFLLIKEIKTISESWMNWKNIHGIKGNPPVNESQLKQTSKQFYNELEQGIKYDMFYLAIHYWEARWIIATEDALKNKQLNSNGIETAVARWQRYAMLTPCFVSTFFMAPKRFTYSKVIKKEGVENTWESPPLLESIDLLIVDEAGQVSPEVGAATFSLAKRAVIVGDIKQIEPVWNVPKKVDYANLHRHGLIPNKDDSKSIEELNDKGFLGSSGSIMMLAQKSSCFQISESFDRGMYLTEHRRCFDEIITYCNKLAYGGILEPLKGPSKNCLFQPMEFIPVDGESINYNSSRSNEYEANAISEWILKNVNAILMDYQIKENQLAKEEERFPIRLVFGDIVAVLTPFTSQKQVIKSALQKAGVDTNVIIGTVHALQGAERPIVLFSSVYGNNDLNMSYFFDRNMSILNVAVSRAKDSFILFGNPKVFEKTKGFPSALLYKQFNSSLINQ